MNCMYDDEGFYLREDRMRSHYATKVRSLLSESFPGKWIKCKGVIDWPAGLPDLTTMDFSMGSCKRHYLSKNTDNND